MAYLIFVRLKKVYAWGKKKEVMKKKRVAFRFHSKAEEQAQVTPQVTFRLQPSIFNDKAQINYL